jgi:SAM-dependent methyltransferase
VTEGARSDDPIVPASGPVSLRGGDKPDRLARVYDSEVVPVYAGRFAAMLLRALNVRPAARVVEVGCATGHLTAELARRFDGDSRITALEASPGLLALAQARLEADPVAGGRVSAQRTALGALPVADGGADIVVSNLAAAEAAGAAGPAAVVRELARVLAPGGQAVITTPLRGTWGEFLDIFRDVLRENGKQESVAALDRYQAALPDGDTAARWLESAGLNQVEIAVERWEILFKSAREFFFAPLIELGPLSHWKQVAGRGDEMQDVFFFTKEAIDTYFKGAVFPVTVVGAAIKAWKPIATGR